MPSKPKRPCSKLGCPELTTERFCPGHKQAEQRRYNRQRGSAHARGYDAKWRLYRLHYLKKHPLCVECMKEGRITAAYVIDHIIPHKGDTTLFWEPQNHQGLCTSHHSAKTAREDGGFGNTIKH